MTRAALYARLSRDRTGEETATGRQLDDCRAFAAAHGWEVVGEYSDADVSAYKRNVARPGYEAMLAELDAGHVDVVVAWKLDRLLRRVMDFEKLWERCEPHGANVATIRDGIDTSTPMVGELLPRLMATFAQLESKSLSVREIRKHEETANRGGRSGGGHRPFGLSRDWSELVEPEAERIRDAVARILAGDSMYAIAREWNAAGVLTPTGKQWTLQQVAAMLRSPRIAGLREHRGAIVARGTWPAIVDPADHERLRAILAARRRPGRPGRFLLSGMVACGRCKSTMVIRRRHTDKVRYYGCEKVNGHVACGGTYVVAEPLEAFVGEIVLAAIDSPALASELRHLEADTTTDDDLAVLHADEQALEQLARDHYVGHLIERAEYLAARDALHSRVETTRGRMSKPGAAALLRELGEDGAGVRAAWAAGDVDWRRRLVSMLVDRVEIGPATRGATRFDPTRVDPIWRA
jgi:DNA invertase Pin-like site-specific DNA recombinase